MKSGIETRRRIRAVALATVMVLSVVTAGVAISGTAAAANTSADLVVGPGEDHVTIQSAVDAASGGETIEVTSGVYDGFVADENVTVDGEGAVYITSNVNLTADGASIRDVSFNDTYDDQPLTLFGDDTAAVNVTLDVGTEHGASISIHGDNAVLRRSGLTRSGDEGFAFVDAYRGPDIVNAREAPTGVEIVDNTLNGGDIGLQLEEGGSVTVTGNDVTPADSDDDAMWVTGPGFSELNPNTTLDVEDNGQIVEVDSRTNGGGNVKYMVSITAALHSDQSSIENGSVVSVPPGVYNETIRVTLDSGEPEPTDLRITGDGATLSPQKEAQMDPRDRIVDLSDAPNTTFTGFTVIGLGNSTDDAGIYTGRAGSNDTIAENVVENVGFGITVGTGVGGVEVVGNEITDTGDALTLLSEPAAVDDNRISGSEVGLITFGGKYAFPRVDPTGNTFAENDVQVDDGSGNFSIPQLLRDNSFDRAVTLEGSGPFEPVIWSAIRDGVSQAGDGDIVTARGGPYDEFVDVGADNVTIRGDDATIALTRETIDDRGNRAWVFDFRGHDDVTVEGFDVVGVGTDSVVGFQISGENAVIRDNDVRDVLTGIQTSSRWDLENDTFGESTGDGAVIAGNHVENVTVGVSIQSHDAEVSNNTIAGVERVAISPLNGRDDVVVSGNELVDVDGPSVGISDNFVLDGSPVTTGSVEVHENDLSGGAEGVNNSVGVDVNATHNYWGHASGPSGKGVDAVGDVEVFPWYIDEDMTVLAGAANDADLQTENNAKKSTVEVDETTSVEVSLNASSAATRISVVETDRSTAPKNVSDDGDNAIYMDISADTDVTDEVSITVNKSVTALESHGIDPENAVLNHFNETSQEWEELDTSVEIRGDRAILTATSEGLSPFAITEREQDGPGGGGGPPGSSGSSGAEADGGDTVSSTGSVTAELDSLGRELSVTVEDARSGDSVRIQRDVEDVTGEVRRHGSAIESIEIAFDQPADFEMTVTSSTNKPDTTIPDPPGDRGTVGYVNVEHSASDDAVDEVRFGFRVTQERLDERGIGRDEVALYRYDDSGEWSALETAFAGANDDGTLRFTAVSPGLSVFAIGGPQAQQETPTDEPTEPTTDEPTESDPSTPTPEQGTEGIEEPAGFSWTAIVAAIALAVVVVAVFVLARRRT